MDQAVAVRFAQTVEEVKQQLADDVGGDHAHVVEPGPQAPTADILEHDGLDVIGRDGVVDRHHVGV